MVVVGVAEQPPGELVLVDRRRDAADPELPGGEHHVRRRPWPRSNITESGPSAAVGSGRHEGDRDRRAGEMAGLRTDGGELARGASRSRQTMNSQRWRFFELPARRPGVEDPDEVVGLERPVGELADHPLGRDRLPDRHRRRRRRSRPDLRPARPSRRVGRCVADRRRRAVASAGAQRSGDRSRASERKPPGSLSIGSAAGPCRAAAGRRRPRRARPPRRARAGRRGRARGSAATVRRYSGNSYSQECWPPWIDERLDRRRAGRSARPGRGGRDGRTARRRRRRRGRAGPAGRSRRERRRVAEISATAMAARPEVDPGREPGERVGDRVGDRQAGEAERLAGEAPRVGRRRRRDDGGDPRLGGRGEDRPDRAHRVAEDRADA